MEVSGRTSDLERGMVSHKSGPSTGFSLVPVQGWSLFRGFAGSYTGVVSHQGFYFSYTGVVSLQGGLIRGFTGSYTGVVSCQGTVVSHQGSYWLLYRDVLRFSQAPAQEWSFIGVVSSIRGFTGSCTGVVSHQGGPPSRFLLAPAQGRSHPSGILLAHAWGGLSLGWSLIWVVLHQGFYWLLYSGGVLLAPVQGWFLIWDFTGSCVWVVSHQGGLSSGVLLVPVQGWAFCQVLLAPVQGWFFIRVFTGACTGMAFHQVLVAPVQGCFFIWDFTGSCAGVFFIWDFTGSCAGVVSHLGHLSWVFLLAPVLASSISSLVKLQSTTGILQDTLVLTSAVHHLITCTPYIVGVTAHMVFIQAFQ